MIRLALITLCTMMLLGTPASAHKLKVFATVKGSHISGYAFFIGGGRAQHTLWTAQDASGAELARGKTDGQGLFDFTPANTEQSAITITVNTQEGHIASAVIPASRLGGTIIPKNTPQPSATDASSQSPPPPNATNNSAALISAEDLEPIIEAAVQRQVEPLLERIEEMDSRMRFTDVLSGVFLIIGLAGAGLWARTRR